MTVTDRLYVSQIEMPNEDIYMSNGQRWLKMVSYDQFEKLEKENKELRELLLLTIKSFLSGNKDDMIELENRLSTIESVGP